MRSDSCASRPHQLLDRLRLIIRGAEVGGEVEGGGHWALGSIPCSASRQAFDCDLAARTYLHVQLVAPQKCHSNERLAISFTNENAAELAVPQYLSAFIHVEEAFAAISEYGAI